MTWHYRLGGLAAQTEVRCQRCFFIAPPLVEVQVKPYERGGRTGEIKGEENDGWMWSLFPRALLFHIITFMECTCKLTRSHCVLISEQISLSQLLSVQDLSSSSLLLLGMRLHSNPRVPHARLSQSPALCQQYKSRLTLTFLIFTAETSGMLEGNSSAICSVYVWYLNIFSSKQIMKWTGNQVQIYWKYFLQSRFMCRESSKLQNVFKTLFCLPLSITPYNEKIFIYLFNK